MSDQHTPRPGEPGHENQPAGPEGQGQRSGAQRRVSPGAPVPGTNQGKAEPIGEAHRQAQRYGESPDPIGSDDAAGARAAAPGGPAHRRDPEPTSGEDAGATYGLRTHAMPGTSEAAAPAEGVRRAAFEVETAGPAQTVETPVTARRTGESGPGSAAATSGEALQPHVEQTVTGDERPGPSHERPVTGVHRPSAPTGEVGSQ